MSQLNPEKFLHNTTFSVQLTYIEGYSFKKAIKKSPSQVKKSKIDYYDEKLKRLYYT